MARIRTRLHQSEQPSLAVKLVAALIRMHERLHTLSWRDMCNVNDAFPSPLPARLGILALMMKWHSAQRQVSIPPRFSSCVAPAAWHPPDREPLTWAAVWFLSFGPRGARVAHNVPHPVRDVLRIGTQELCCWLWSPRPPCSTIGLPLCALSLAGILSAILQHHPSSLTTNICIAGVLVATTCQVILPHGCCDCQDLLGGSQVG